MISLMLDDRFDIQTHSVCGVSVSGYPWDRDKFEVTIEKSHFGEDRKFTVDYEGSDQITIKCDDLTVARDLANIFRTAADLLDRFEKINTRIKG
ncbi:MAG: hypothetical protein MJZ85_11025 [Bacteroidales bacterium]|nr:hypothetical protein [Bacteroidales bacterium]